MTVGCIFSRLRTQTPRATGLELCPGPVAGLDPEAGYALPSQTTTSHLCLDLGPVRIEIGAVPEQDQAQYQLSPANCEHWADQGAGRGPWLCLRIKPGEFDYASQLGSRTDFPLSWYSLHSFVSTLGQRRWRRGLLGAVLSHAAVGWTTSVPSMRGL